MTLLGETGEKEQIMGSITAFCSGSVLCEGSARRDPQEVGDMRLI